MVDLGSEAGVLKLSSTVAGAVAAMSLLAPDKFQDTFYDAVRPLHGLDSIFQARRVQGKGQHCREGLVCQLYLPCVTARCTAL